MFPFSFTVLVFKITSGLFPSRRITFSLNVRCYLNFSEKITDFLIFKKTDTFFTLKNKNYLNSFRREPAITIFD